MSAEPWKSEFHWVRPGQQERSRRTQETLLQAAAELVAEHGIEGTTIADIAAGAGVSVGAVYHHFSDKKAITHALFERYGEMVEATTAQAVDPNRWEGASISDILRGYLIFVLRHGDEATGFRRAGQHLIRVDDVMFERMSEMRLRLDGGLTALLLDRVDEIGHPEPTKAIALVLDQYAGMLRSRILERAAPTQLDKMSNREWVDTMLESATAFLRLNPPNPQEA